MNKHFIFQLISGTFLLFLISCSVSEISETSVPEMPSSPNPGACNSCHESNKVISGGHVETKGMMGDKCDMCHKEGSSSLRGKIPLSHMHQLKGVSCKKCHDDPASAKAVDATVCKKCHDDMNALYSATSEMGLNPHFSPHEGKVSDCNRCHHQHKTSENFCTDCHRS